VLQNAGHVVLFGILALVLLCLLPQGVRARYPGRWSRYLIVLGLTLLVGLLTEGLQALGFGEPSLVDLGRDLAGGVAFLSIHAAVTVRADARRRWFFALVGGIILLGMAVSPAVWIAGYVARDQRFPCLLDADSALSRLFVQGVHAEFSAVPAPDDWIDAPGGQVGRLQLQPAEYSGMILHEPVPEWSGCRQLLLELYAGPDSPPAVTIRIDDRAHQGDPRDRYNETLPLKRGVNRILIPVERIRGAPAGRTMDMDAIVAVHLFASRLAAPAEILVGRITLIR
jgi:hypothetical protein